MKINMKEVLPTVKIIIISILLAVGISVAWANNHTTTTTTTLGGTVTAGWATPPASPPGSNVKPPINVGSEDQEKAGGLALGGSLLVDVETLTDTLLSGKNTHLAFEGGVTTIGTFVGDDDVVDTHANLEVYGDVMIEANPTIGDAEGSIAASNLSNEFSTLGQATLCASAGGKIVLCDGPDLVVDLNIRSGFPNALDAFGFHFTGDPSDHGVELEWNAQSNQAGTITCERSNGSSQWNTPSQVGASGFKDIAAFTNAQIGWIDHDITCTQSLPGGGTLTGNASEVVFVDSVDINLDPNWTFIGCEWLGTFSTEGMIQTPITGPGYSGINWNPTNGGSVASPGSTTTQITIPTIPNQTSLGFDVIFSASRFNPSAQETINRSVTKSYSFNLPADPNPC